MKDKLSVVIPAASLVVILLCVAFQVRLFFDGEDKSATEPKPSPAVVVEEQNTTPQPDEIAEPDLTPEVTPEPVDDSVSAMLDSGMSVEEIMEEKFGYVEDPNQPEPTVVEMENPEGAEHKPEVYRTHTTYGLSFYDNTVPYFYDAERFVQDNLEELTDETGSVYRTADWAPGSDSVIWTLDIDTASGDVIRKEFKMDSYEISEEEFRAKYDLLDPTYSGPYMINDAGDVVLK